MKYIKYTKNLIITVVIGIATFWLWKIIFTTNVSYDNITRIENVKDMIRLNSLDIVDEFVYTDTINDVGVVYNIKARVVIGFDLDNMKYKESNGVLEIELPPYDNIAIHSLDCRLLDYYNIGFTGDFFGKPDIGTEEWVEIRSNMQEYIKKTIIQKGYAQRARTSAINNLAKLCHALKGDVKIIDNQNEATPKNDIEYGKITFTNEIINQ